MKKQISVKIIFLLGFVMILNGCSPLKNLPPAELSKLYPPDTTEIKYHNEWTKKHYMERIHEFEKDPLNFGDIIFVGNSITEQGKDWSIRLGIPNIKNRGIGGDVTDGLLRRLDEITYFKPKAIFLLIGINDLSNLYYQKAIPSPEYVASNILKITKIIHTKTPKTKIYVQTILPTDKEFMKSNISIVNNIIINHENEGIYKVVDLHSAFIDADGLMRKNLTTDGIHLNEQGYAVWVDLVKPLLINK